MHRGPRIMDPAQRAKYIGPRIARRGPASFTGPVKDSPVKDSPVKDSPVKDSPVKDSPVKDSPVKDSPVKDSPVKDSPVKDSPVKDSPASAHKKAQPRGWAGSGQDLSAQLII
jgi:hypothetical protein